MEFQSSSTDFWWLSQEESRQYRFIDLFHQDPYSDEPNTDRDPASCPMLKSDKRYPLEFINQWKERFGNTGVFRSYALYANEVGNNGIVGPMLLDIDRTIERDGGYLPDFGKALKDTRLLVEGYCSSLEIGSYRIFFSGHKGFHVEVKPEATGISPSAKRWQHFENIRKSINRRFGDSFIDKFHPHVRLHDSINSWIGYDSVTVNAMTFEVGISDLFRLSADDIFARAIYLSDSISNP